MASSASILLLLIITISSPLLQGRESQFFSKVTNTPTQTNTVVLPDKEQEQQSQVNKPETQPQQEQQPEFVPQNQNGHGLYGQENTGTETKSGVQTQTPGTYASERLRNERNRAETEETEQFGNREGETFYSNNVEKYKNDDASFDFDDSEDQYDDVSFYSNNHNGVGTEQYYTTNKNQNDDTSYHNTNYNGAETEHYYTKNDNIGETETYDSNIQDNNQFGNQLSQTETSYNDNGFTNELNTRYNKYRADTIKPQNTRWSNVERQGMSDTRFLANGKYYYDLNKEQNQYANQNNYKYNYNNYNPNSNYNSRQYQSNDVDRVNANYYDNNRVYDNTGGEKYEFNTMDEYEQSRNRQNQYDP